MVFFEVNLEEKSSTYVLYKILQDTEVVMGAATRGRSWSQDIYVMPAQDILDIVGIWDGASMIYILQKHPGIDMLTIEECGLGKDTEYDQL